jgi:hypothetical protein
MVEFLVVVEACNWDFNGAVVGTGPPMGGPLCRLFSRLALSLFVKQHCEGQYISKRGQFGCWACP